MTKKNQCGGAVRMPAEYYGQDSGRYFPKGSPELAVPSCQRPASFGTIFADGTVGPVLRTQYGGRHSKSHKHTKSKSSKSKSKSSKSKKLSLKKMRSKLEQMKKRLSKSMKGMRKSLKLTM